LEDLKKVCGIVSSTFREAAASLYGLLQTDNSLEKCLEEASSSSYILTPKNDFVDEINNLLTN
jgi:hypothetical protein